MERRKFLLGAVVATLAAQTSSSKLTVQVTYNGSGTVDEKRKVFVVLWNTPIFAKEDSDVRPIDVKGLTSKTGTVEFNKIKKSPVYLSLVYDPAGGWGTMGPPPSGSSLGLYEKEPGTPAPIDVQPGKIVKVEATFDDSNKMK